MFIVQFVYFRVYCVNVMMEYDLKGALSERPILWSVSFLQVCTTVHTDILITILSLSQKDEAGKFHKERAPWDSEMCKV